MSGNGPTIDYAPILEHEDRAQRVTGGICAVIALAVAMAFLLMSLLDAMLEEQTLREQNTPPLHSVATMSLSRPAAFRTASPTMEQMDNLSATLRVVRGW